MRQIRIDKRRLYIPFLTFLIITSILSTGIYYLMNDVSPAVSSERSLHFSLIMMIYWGSFVVVPLLLVRLLYNLFLLLRYGRKVGVKVICAQTLFNPLNFLLFPSLLNEEGLVFRRRCFIACILLVFLFGLAFYLAGYVPELK